MAGIARFVLLISTVVLAAMFTMPVPALAAGTWTSPGGRLTISTYDYTQFKYDPCVSFTFLTVAVTPDPSHPHWVVNVNVYRSGILVDQRPVDSPETQYSFINQYCGKTSEAGEYSVILRYHGLDDSGNFIGTPDEVTGTFTVATLPLTSTTTLKVKPRTPDFRDKVSFVAQSFFNEGANINGEVQLQFRWAGRWQRLTTLNLDTDGAADIKYKWKLCNRLKFRALTVGERRGPPPSHSEAIAVTIDQRGTCVTANSPRQVRQALG